MSHFRWTIVDCPKNQSLSGESVELGQGLMTEN